MFRQHIKKLKTLCCCVKSSVNQNSIFWVRDGGGIKIKRMAFVVLSDWSCWLSLEMGSGLLGEQGKGRQGKTQAVFFDIQDGR